jgi:hypothetical protein
MPQVPPHTHPRHEHAQYVDKGGDIMTGNLAVEKSYPQIRLTTETVGHTPDILIEAPAGTNRNVTFRTGKSHRWQINASGGAESGADAGSNLNVYRYDDAGAYLDAPLSISRATGKASFPNPVKAPAYEMQFATETMARGLHVGSLTVPSASITGGILIELPPPAASSAGMLSIEVRGYNYSTTSGAWRMLLGGYVYKPAGSPASWVSTSVRVEGYPPSNMVRFLAKGTDSTARWAIFIGEVGTVWSYPNVSVDVVAGHNGGEFAKERWTTSIVTSYAGWTVDAVDVSDEGLVTAFTNFTDYGSTYAGLFVTRNGPVATVDCLIKPTTTPAWTAGTPYQIGTVPVGFRPAHDVISAAIMSYGSVATTYPARVTITTAGVINCHPLTAGTMTTGGWIAVNSTYRLA